MSLATQTVKQLIMQIVVMNDQDMDPGNGLETLKISLGQIQTTGVLSPATDGESQSQSSAQDLGRSRGRQTPSLDQKI